MLKLVCYTIPLSTFNVTFCSLSNTCTYIRQIRYIEITSFFLWVTDNPSKSAIVNVLTVQYSEVPIELGTDVLRYSRKIMIFLFILSHQDKCDCTIFKLQILNKCMYTQYICKYVIIYICIYIYACMYVLFNDNIAF